MTPVRPPVRSTIVKCLSCGWVQRTRFKGRQFVGLVGWEQDPRGGREWEANLGGGECTVLVPLDDIHTEESKGREAGRMMGTFHSTTRESDPRGHFARLAQSRSH